MADHTTAPYHLFDDANPPSNESSSRGVESSTNSNTKLINDGKGHIVSRDATNALNSSSGSIKRTDSKSQKAVELGGPFSKSTSSKHSRGSSKRSVQPNEEFTFSFKDLIANNFYLSSAWSPDYYYTMRGSEQFHMYLWILEDFFWAQDDRFGCYIFGGLAIAWCFVLLYYAIHARNLEEIYLWLPNTLWIVADFMWMTGEVTTGDDDYVAPRSAFIMIGAIAMIMVYHMVLKPLGVFKLPENFQESHYGCPDGLKSRFSYFETWRSYENAHTFCWLAIDLCWNRGWILPWFLFLVPTIFIAVDFIWVTFRTKNMMEASVHYLAQLFWVVGNTLWAIGNFFINNNTDDAAVAINTSRGSKTKMRYYASWVLLASFFPLIILYCIWLPLTYWGKLPKAQPEEYYPYPQFNEEGIKPSSKVPSAAPSSKTKIEDEENAAL